WYLREVANSHLELPDYELNSDRNIKVYYRELFCRKPECSKAQKKYTATNNLLTYLKTHTDLSMQKENSGGRVLQKKQDEVISKWFLSRLFSGVEPQDVSAGQSNSASSNASIHPPLPLKRDGTVHVTNMRKKIIDIGYRVPCNSCSNRNDCCKDINKYDHFIYFNCSDLHPAAAGLEVPDQV
ncbi:hypothetical protein BO71DRAFT_328512, partial [Aspergillus ellipticus CBS 707.79]